jgi:hypothetical protein
MNATYKVPDMLGNAMRVRLGALSIAAVLFIGGAHSLSAQSRAAGNVGPDKRIFTKIFISVGDAAAPPYPIQSVSVFLISESDDTVRLTTDGAGATTRFVPRGRYRLVTSDWVSTAGKDFKWSMPVDIAPGMRDIVLTESNAFKPDPIVAESPGEVGLTETARATPIVSANAPAIAGASRMLTDSAGLAWEVFEEHFLESAVAHRGLPLPDNRVVLLFNNDTETRELQSFPANWRSLSNSQLAALLVQATRIRP